MHTILGLLSAIVVVMILGINEPCTKQSRPPVAKRAAIAAEVRDGKVIVSFAERERPTVRRVVLSELTTERYTWELELSRDGGETWEPLRHAAYPSCAEQAA